MAIKRIQLRGISHTPSDNMTADGGCDESVNFFLNQEEQYPMDKIELVGSDIIEHTTESKFEVAFIHNTSSYRHVIHELHESVNIGETTYNPGLFYIVRTGSAPSYSYTYNSLMTYNNDEVLKKIEAVGNTLIVLTNQRMAYILFKDSYIYLGTHIPEPKIKVEIVPQINEISPADLSYLKGEYYQSYTQTEWDALSSVALRIIGRGWDEGVLVMTEDDVKTWSDSDKSKLATIIDIVNSRDDIKFNFIINNYQALIRPVFIRYAFKLYDGTSYQFHSAPILVDPNDFLEDMNKMKMYYSVLPTMSQTYVKHIGFTIRDSYAGSIKSVYLPYKLKFVVENTSSELSNWHDIISCIEIFASPTIDKFRYEFHKSTIEQEYQEGAYRDFSEFELKNYSEREMRDFISSKSQFFSVKKLTFDEYVEKANSQVSEDKYITIDDYQIFKNDNLTTSDTLPDDVGQSRRLLLPNEIITFNQRLLLSSVIITYPDLYHQLPSVQSAASGSMIDCQYTVFFKCKNQDGANVTQVKQYAVGTKPGAWLYYPEPRCYSASVYRKTSGDVWYVTEVTMKEDEYLNGAFYFAGWDAGASLWEGTLTSAPSLSVNTKVYNYNVIYQTGANNPLFIEQSKEFPSEILGQSVITAPLSQGQFGYADLYIFTGTGIYTLSTNADGSFGAYKYLSSSVAYKDTICQLEQSIAFVSSRGLMLLVGSQLRCLSDKMINRGFTSSQLTGLSNLLQNDNTYKMMKDTVMDSMSFFEFIKDCTTVHDVSGNRILMFKTFAAGAIKGYCYVYDFNTDSFHKCLTPTSNDGTVVYNFSRSINGYPNAIVTFKKCSGVSAGEFFTAGCNQNNCHSRGDAVTVNQCMLITRTVNLDETYARKRINNLRIRGEWDITSNPASQVQYILYGSMDGNTWSRVESLHGESYRFFRIAVLATLKPWEKISWIDVDYTTCFAGKVM